jgi:hypothetical protein
MKKCKWAGDQGDEYCKSCDGVTMDVDGKSIPCDQCAGYEAGTDDVASEEIMPEPIEEKTEDKSTETNVENVTKNKQNSPQNSTKTEKTNNNTPNEEKGKNKEKTKGTSNKDKVVKIADEKNTQEKVSKDNGEIKVTSLRYTSGATIKKGDNYFKFIAEEEWDVSRIEDVQEAREKLWAKLNAEVDSQIEELNNMN